MNKLKSDLKPNVLVVDDILDNLLLVEAILKKLDVNLIFAESGKEALLKIKDKEIALAMLDIHMPMMDGVKLAEKIQSSSAERIPIIFITAYFKDEIDLENYYKMGAVDFIHKPFRKNILISKVEVFLELYRQKQQIKEQKDEIQNHLNELKGVNLSLNKRLAYESVLFDISEKAVSVNDMGQFSSAVLKVIGESLNLCRTYIFEYSDATNTIKNTQVWCRERVPSNKEFLQEIPVSLMSFLMGILRIDKIFNFSNIENIPDKSTVEFLREQNVLSILAIPLFVKGKFFGFISFSDCTKHREWETQDIEFLLSISRIIVAVSERKMAEEELKSSLVELHRLTQHVQKVREEERVAIARELHDDLGQSLTAVKIDLGIIRQNISDEKIMQKIIKVAALVSETIKTVQKITFQLRPSIIDDLGLEAGIEWYTSEFSERNGIEVNLEIKPDIIISPEISLVIFRIMQESLTNISRHAKATKIDILLNESAENISFVVKDNGIGISETQLNSKISFGIIGMKERADSVGGKLKIMKNNEGGTSLKLTFPSINKIV
jgi:signal transduction histidine kinase/CheY-like chemotaxis protein